MRRVLRWATLVALVAAGVALARALLARRQVAASIEPPGPPSWPPLEPAGEAEPEAAAPPEPAVVEDTAVEVPATWVAPVDKACPDGYPVKAKVASHVYHLPGMAMYDRTTPDRCYASPADAEADGFRAAKR